LGVSTPRNHIAGIEVELHDFLTMVLDIDKWLISRLALFIPGKKDVCTHSMAGLVDPRDSLDMLEKRRSFSAGK
jgi:hypothetical protein